MIETESPGGNGGKKQGFKPKYKTLYENMKIEKNQLHGEVQSLTNERTFWKVLTFAVIASEIVATIILLTR